MQGTKTSLFRFKCKRCINNIQTKLPPEGSDCTSDLSSWYHSAQNKGIPDEIFSRAWDAINNVSFVFHHRSSAAVAEQTVADPETQPKKEKKYISDDEYDEKEDISDDSDEDYTFKGYK